MMKNEHCNQVDGTAALGICESLLLALTAYDQRMRHMHRRVL
jgi:hypothetical protein